MALLMSSERLKQEHRQSPRGLSGEGGQALLIAGYSGNISTIQTSREVVGKRKERLISLMNVDTQSIVVVLAVPRSLPRPVHPGTCSEAAFAQQAWGSLPLSVSLA